MLLPSVTVFHAHIYCVTISPLLFSLFVSLSLSLSLSLFFFIRIDEGGILYGVEVVEFGVANQLFEQCDGNHYFETDSLV